VTIEGSISTFDLEGRVAFGNRASAVNWTRAWVAATSDRAPHHRAFSGAGFDPAAVGVRIFYPDNSPHGIPSSKWFEV